MYAANTKRSRQRPLYAALSIVGVIWSSAAHGQGRVATCVEVRSVTGDPKAFERLVRAELDRHATHEAAEESCVSYLSVEFIELDEKMGGGRYVTGRINAQVPHREPVVDNDVADGVERLLTVLLHNDPLRLHGPRHDGWFRRQSRSLRRKGVNLYGVEAYQVGVWLDGEVASLPGVAFVARREVDRWHLGVRLSGAFEPDPSRDSLQLTGIVSAQIETAMFFSPAEDVSLYVAAVIGLEHQRFHGPVTLVEEDARRSVSKSGLAGGVRGGIEILRTTSGRVDFFGQLLLPAFASTDDETGVVDQWVPSATLGVGILF